MSCIFVTQSIMNIKLPRMLFDKKIRFFFRFVLYFSEFTVHSSAFAPGSRMALSASLPFRGFLNLRVQRVLVSSSVYGASETQSVGPWSV